MERRMIAFTIPGQPVAKGRPKFARRGAHVVAYTPAKTASYENLVKLAADDRHARYAADGSTSGPVGHAEPADPGQLVEEAPRGRCWRFDLRHEEARRRQRAQGDQGRLQRDRVGRRCPGGRIMLEKRYSETPGAVVSVSVIDGEAA
jgi:hypothetical protein